MTSEKTKVINQSNIDTVRMEKISNLKEEFVFGDGRLVSSMASKILCLDLTDKYLKYTMFSKRNISIKWFYAGKLLELPVQDQETEKIITAGINILSLKLNLNKVKILVIIDGFDFFLRHIKIPELKGKALIEAVKWECDKQIPFAIKDAYFKILNTRKTAEGIQVLTAIITKKAVDRFSFLGDKLLGVIPAPIALSGNFLSKTNTEQLTDIVNCWGHSEAIIDFIYEGRLEFCKSSKLHEESIVDDYMIQPVNISEKLENNLKNSLDFYYSLFPSRQINKIMAYDSARRKVTDKLSQAPGLESTCENPYSSMIKNPKNLRQFWEISESDYILGAGAVQLNERNIFLPHVIKQLLNLNRLKAISRKFSIFAILMIIILAASFMAENSYRRKSIEQLQHQIDIIESSAAFSEAVRCEQKVNANLASISKLKQPANWAADLLKAASHSVTPGVYFNMMDLIKSGDGSDAIEIRIEGYYYGNTQKADVRVAGFIENFHRYCGFEKKNLERFGETIEGANKRLNFVLTGSTRIGKWTAK